MLLSLAALAEPGLRRAGAGGGSSRLALAMLAVVPLGAMQLWPTVPAGAAGRGAARLRVSLGLRRDAGPPGQLRGARAVPAIAALAAGGLGPVPHLARGAPGVRRPGAAVPGAGRAGPRGPPRAGDCGCWRSLALATLVLSLGPYVPGFRHLIRLPGFSFFRAPARWGLATELALACWPGEGSTRSRPGRGPGGRWRGSRWSRRWPGAGRRGRSSWRWRVTERPAGMPGWSAVLDDRRTRSLPWPSREPTRAFRT